MLFSPDFTTLKYGLNYHKTTGSHLLVMFSFFFFLYFPWMYARFSVCFFVYMLVSVLRVSVTADLICSDLMFYCSRRSTKCPCCCCRCRCSVCTHFGMSGLLGLTKHVNEIKVALLLNPLQTSDTLTPGGNPFVK